jgi:hypothetical protein
MKSSYRLVSRRHLPQQEWAGSFGSLNRAVAEYGMRAHFTRWRGHAVSG